jgi:CRP/FNR family transcriptional regulator, dissimilatory nitrate respiration regulator
MTSLTAADLELCSQVPMFHSLQSDELAWLLDGAMVQTYTENTLLFSQGDKADRFYIVMAGRVNLFALTERGDQSIIEVFDPVQSFAEAALFSSGRYPLNCEVVSGSRLLPVAGGVFMKRLSERRPLALRLLAGLADKRVMLIDEISELKSKSPVQRLATFLLTLAKNSPTTEQGAHVRLPITKAVLASRIGIAPESLSRALARLKGAGVESQGRELILTNLEALRAMVKDAD